MKKHIFDSIKKMYYLNSYLYNDIKGLNLIDVINNDLKSGYLKVYLKYETIIFDDDDQYIEYIY